MLQNPIRRKGSQSAPQGARFAALWIVVLACQVFLAVGCHRSYYRRQADADASRLLAEKSNNEHWQLNSTSIKTDPRSRMDDPFSADHPPLPPDDPAAHCYMKEVDGKAGYQHWHANGDTRIVENPEWQSFLPIDEDGYVTLDMERAYRLALLHSREFQRQKEELYLAALDVSLERFGFQTQFFSPYSGTLSTEGSDRNGLARTDGVLGNVGTGKRFTKAGIAGSQLVVNLANSLVWQLSGPDSNRVNTTLGFELMQPLLRRAGRDRILETLTESERDLLANVRQMERFRRGFYLQVTVGSNAGSGVSRGGNGLSASSGGATSGGGGLLGLLQTQQNIRISEANVTSQRNVLERFEQLAASGEVSLLQLQQTRTSLYSAQTSLVQAKANYESALDEYKILLGLPPETKVRIEDPLLEPYILISNAILDRQADLTDLQKRAGDIIVPFIEDEDYIRTEIEEEPADLFDPDFDANLDDEDEADDEDVADGDENADADQEDDPADDVDQDANDDAIDGADEDADAAEDKDAEDEDKEDEDKEDAVKIEWNEELAEGIRQLQSVIEEAQETSKQIRDIDLPQTEKDIEGFKAGETRRKEQLQTLNSRLEQLKEQKYSQDGRNDVPVIEPAILDLATLTETNSELKRGLTDILRKVDQIEEVLTEQAKLLEELLEKGPELSGGKLKEALKKDAFDSIPEALTKLLLAVGDISLVQARARIDSLVLENVELSAEQALEIARVFRRDWMNARADLVDRWRKIEFIADDLESQLDLTFSGDIQNVGDNPLNLQPSAGRLALGFQFDAPITRLSERNSYRSALINYQRTRRDYMRFKDRVSQNLRLLVRNVEFNQLNFELLRTTVKVAVQGVELAQLELVRPVQPGQQGNRLGANTARDLLGALDSLQRTQQQLVDAYVNFEVQRRNLDFQMGTMQLDAEGFWIDPGEITAERGLSLPPPYGSLPLLIDEPASDMRDVQADVDDRDEPPLADDGLEQPEPIDADAPPGEDN